MSIPLTDPEAKKNMDKPMQQFNGLRKKVRQEYQCVKQHLRKLLPLSRLPTRFVEVLGRTAPAVLLWLFAIGFILGAVAGALVTRYFAVGSGWLVWGLACMPAPVIGRFVGCVMLAAPGDTARTEPVQHQPPA